MIIHSPEPQDTYFICSRDCVVQPLSRSINHVAAAATAVGLTMVFGASGFPALILGISLLIGTITLFHYLL